MIERIARRAGGFASTTAMRWLGAAGDGLPDAVVPSHGSAAGKLRRRAVTGAAAGAVALISSNKTVRAGLERGLRAASQTLRTGPAPSGNSRNGRSSDGSGAARITEKTKAELYELAKKMDLPGRSAMSKDELAKALGK